jgi:hypothetical protein
MSIRVLSLALVQVHAAVILRGPGVTEDSYIRGGSSHSDVNKNGDAYGWCAAIICQSCRGLSNS